MAIPSEEPVKRRYDPSMSRRTRKSGSYISSVENPMQIYGKDEKKHAFGDSLMADSVEANGKEEKKKINDGFSSNASVEKPVQIHGKDDQKKQAFGDSLMEASVESNGKEKKTQSDNNDSENPMQFISINEEEKKTNVGFISSASMEEQAFGDPLMVTSIEANGKEEKNPTFTDDDENPMQINGNMEEDPANICRSSLEKPMQIHGKDEKKQAFGDPLMVTSVEANGKEQENPIFTDDDENPMQINGNMEENPTNICRSSLEIPMQIHGKDEKEQAYGDPLMETSVEANGKEDKNPTFTDDDENPMQINGSTEENQTNFCRSSTKSDMNNMENTMKFNENEVENQSNYYSSMQINGDDDMKPTDGVRRSSLEILMKGYKQNVDLATCKLAMESTGEEEEEEDEKKKHLLVVVKHSNGLKGAKMVTRYAKFLKYLIKGTRGHKNKNAVRWPTK